ncbi:MAG: Stp1/IreP family PP2C-type Ser/Thr phosphatase [Actinomycetia bacterium]|nr:Stp1/IreP family PP2C-type Ser/Thr phosphatase [Actinomycetes bacterium]
MKKRSAGSALSIGAATHVGRVRTGNEDAFIAEPLVVGVADGMGGHQAGEVASAIAVQMVRDRLGQGAPSLEAAEAAVVAANSAIFKGARDNSDQRGMGTTLTALIVLAAEEAAADSVRRFVLLNVGDSRTYLLRGGRLRRVTVDHSYVQELVSTGHITEIEARTHPRRNIVTRALGIESTVRVDSWVMPFVKGDRFLLCSDGLVDEVDDREIAEVMAANSDAQRAADALVEAANQHGGRDNTTVVVVDVLEGDVTVDDTADLDLDLVWIDQPKTGEIAIQTDANPQPVEALPLEDELPLDQLSLQFQQTAPAEPAASGRQITEEIPITKSFGSAPRKRFGFGTLLFWFGIAAIITGAVTLVLAVRHNAGDDPTPVPTTPATTVVVTTTRATTTTTAASTTTSIAATTTTLGGP